VSKPQNLWKTCLSAVLLGFVGLLRQNEVGIAKNQSYIKDKEGKLVPVAGNDFEFQWSADTKRGELFSHKANKKLYPERKNGFD
jgi:hypothetical protein